MKNKLISSALTGFFVFLLSLTVQAATIQVTTTADDYDDEPPCSLREAIQSVNNGDDFGGCVAEGAYGDSDTIELEAETYLLTRGGAGDDSNSLGDLDIQKDVVINGQGLGSTTIDGSGMTTCAGGSCIPEDRVIELYYPEMKGEEGLLTATFNGFTVTGGDALTYGYAGGGIRVGYNSALTINQVRVFDNEAERGGGIEALGELAVNESLIDGNIAEYPGGGIYHLEQRRKLIPCDGQICEGIRAIVLGELDFGTLIIQNSTIENNTSRMASGGGIYNEGRTTIDQTTIRGNTAAVDGGGYVNAMSYFSFSSTYITNSTISGNTASSENPGDSCSGGGIFSSVYSNLIMVNSTVSGNTAVDAGGGIFVGFGFRGDTISQVSVQGEKQEFPIVLQNVTVAQNQVTADDGRGGGIAIQPFLMGDGDGEGPVIGQISSSAEDMSPAGTWNSLFADNQAANGADCFGVLASGGYNLLTVHDDDCPIALIPGAIADSDKLNVPAGIGALQDNGGPTETHGLNEGSLAIDMANPEGCQAFKVEGDEAPFLEVLTRDQRNFARPVDGLGDGESICDIGAFEFGSFTFDVVKTDDATGAIGNDDQFTYTITVTNSGPSDALMVTLSDPLPAALSFVGFGNISQGSCVHDGAAQGGTVSCDLGEITVGGENSVSIQIIVQAIAVDGSDLINIVTVTAEGKDFQSPFSKTAQDTTPTRNVGDLFGSGCGLSLNGPVPLSHGVAYLCLAFLLAFTMRRRWLLAKK